MPNVLILSFEGFSFSARQLYEQLLPRLLSRAAVHESTTFQDALNYIQSGWPNVILVTDSVIAEESDDAEQLLEAVADYTKHGHTTVLMGLFSASIDHKTLNFVFNEHFGLRWEVAESASHETVLANPDESLIRTRTLTRNLYPEAVYLKKVSSSEAVYMTAGGVSHYVYGAITRVGLGKLGYVGEIGFGNESERLILAMCHLDRPEDSPEGMDDKGDYIAYGE